MADVIWINGSFSAGKTTVAELLVAQIPGAFPRPDYFDEVIGEVRKQVHLDHFTLLASRDTVLRREATRPDDTGDWATKTLDRVLPELSNDRYAIHLNAEAQSPQKLAAEILSRVAQG